MKKLIIGISGASGIVYAEKLLQILQTKPDVETHLVVSKAAEQARHLETDLSSSAVKHRPSGLTITHKSKREYRVVFWAIFPAPLFPRRVRSLNFCNRIAIANWLLGGGDSHRQIAVRTAGIKKAPAQRHVSKT